MTPSPSESQAKKKISACCKAPVQVNVMSDFGIGSEADGIDPNEEVYHCSDCNRSCDLLGKKKASPDQPSML